MMKMSYIAMTVLVFLTVSLPMAQTLFINKILGPDTQMQGNCEATGVGKCMFDLSCRLSYGQNVGECGGFYQVCCALPNSVGSSRQKRVLVVPDQEWREAPPAIECGKTAIAGRRVVGGTEAGFGSFPWMALVRGSTNRCGGALISSRWVVTAGHCVRGHDSVFNAGYRVYLGEYRLYLNSEPLPRQKFYVEKVVVHPLYQFTPQADRYDLALLKLNKPASMMPHISPICLPDPSTPTQDGVRSFVSGWGATDPDSYNRPKVLQAVDVLTINNTDCEEWHRSAGIRVNIYKEMMCAGHREGGRDACQGDSGGPLMTKDDNGLWTLIGVVSAGYSCAKPGQPGIYHRLSETTGWIHYVTQNEVK